MLITVVCNIQKTISIVAVLACSVNFKLNAEISGAITIENRLRLVAIIMNGTVVISYVVITLRAVELPFVFVCIVIVNQSVTLGTAAIIILIAVTAKCGIVISISV